MRVARVLGVFACLGLATGCGQKAAETRTKAEELKAHEDGERYVNDRVAALAWGGAEEARVIPRAPWPVPVLSIGHTSASYQNYGGDPYFHHGLDIRSDAGNEVHAARGGKVVNIENYMGGSAYWEIAILDDDGYLWQYHHVDHDSIPQQIQDAFRSGEKIADGAKLGEVYYWEVVTFGERYHHIHLNVLGANKKFLNPFDFLEPLADDQAPQFVDVGIVKNGQRWTGRTVNGQYTVYAQVHDLIKHQKFFVPPQKLTYAVDGGAPVTVWDFSDGLPGGASENQYVHDFYVRSLTCGDYECRKLTINVGFATTGTRWFTTTRGPHKVALTATDHAGNSTSKEYTWTVE